MGYSLSHHKVLDMTEATEHMSICRYKLYMHKYVLYMYMPVHVNIYTLYIYVS